MKQRHFQLLSTFSLFIIDIATIIFAHQVAYAIRFEWTPFLEIFPITKGIPDFRTYQLALYAALPIWGLAFIQTGFYREGILSPYDELVRILKGVVLAFLLTSAISFAAYQGVAYSRLVIGMWAFISILLLYACRELWKFIFRRGMARAASMRHLLIVGKNPMADVVHQMVAKHPRVQGHVLETVPDVETFEAALKQKDITEVFLMQGGLDTKTILDIANHCEFQSLDYKIVPDLLEMRRGEIIVDSFLGLPTFRLKSLSLHGTNYYLKRSFDIVSSLTILTVLALPLLFISLLIRLDSPGPILFTQNRMGLRGRHFKFFKFRTMVADADSQIEKLKHLSDRPGPVFKMKDDPRVTHVGGLLRQYSLDELPQIINVLRGDMSLVGPRPQVLWEAAHYDEHARKRLRVMPGITGLWQVSGRAALSFEEMINLDVYYLENWSLGLDLKILMRTLPAVFSGDGAY